MSPVAAALTGGSYLRTLAASNGSDDTAWLNTALAAAGALRGRPGETYKLSGPLVIRSDTFLDVSGCVFEPIVGFAGQMLANYAALNPTYRNEDCTATAGSNVLQLTNKAAAANYVVGQTVVQDGAGGSGGPTFSPGAIVPLVAAVTAVDLVAGTVTVDKPARTSTPAWALTAYNRDKNITVRGGKWSRGAYGYTGVAIRGNSLHFRHVDTLIVEIDEFYSESNVAHYPISAADFTNGRFAITRVRSGRDGIHLMGPFTNAHVSHIAGYTADDMLSVTAADYAGGLTDSAGDCVGLTWGVISGHSHQSLVKLLAGVNCRVDEVRGGLVRGTSESHVAWVGEDTGNLGTVGGTYGHIDLGTVAGRPTNPATKAQLFLASPTIDQLRAVQVLTASSGFATAAGLGGTGNAAPASPAVIERAHITYDVTGPARLLSLPQVGTTVRHLVVDGRYRQSSGSDSAIALVAGALTALETRLLAILTGSMVSQSDAFTLNRVHHLGQRVGGTGLVASAAGAVAPTVSGSGYSGP